VDLDVVFLGTSGSAPTARRAPPALLIRRGGERLLFDCGEGTQRQLLQSAVGLVDLREVFLTHFHLDHWLGLPGMLKTFALRDRQLPLTIYGPPGVKELFTELRRVIGRLPYPFEPVEVRAGDTLEREGYRVLVVPVAHGVAAVGYALDEEPRPGRTIVYSGDTAPIEVVRAVAENADVLVHEATFAEEERDRAADTMHSTALQAAQLAREAEVRLLALTHVSPRYFGPELVREAREIFANTVVPRDFDVVEVPFPERGEPVLVKGGALPDRSGDKLPAT
jgi:ribonuclease Z